MLFTIQETLLVTALVLLLSRERTDRSYLFLNFYLIILSFMKNRFGHFVIVGK
jgi:hypothetical protein